VKVVVVGGGVLGASAAFRLAARGAGTVLVDAAGLSRATSAGAGITCPCSMKPVTSIRAKPVLRYSRMPKTKAKGAATAKAKTVTSSVTPSPLRIQARISQKFMPCCRRS